MYIEKNEGYPRIIADDGRILIKNLKDGTLEILYWKKEEYKGSANVIIKEMKKDFWQALENYLFREGGWSTCTELEDLTGIDWRKL